MLDALQRAGNFLGETVLGLSVHAEQLGFGQMVARAVLMYLIMIALVRSAKKRFLGQATAFDMILAVMLGSIAARAITGGIPYFPSVLGMIALVALHWLFSLIARDVRWFSGLIKGHATRLILDGKVDRRALREAHMSDDDLDEDLRQQGVIGTGDVAEARLERSGQLSVVRAKKSAKQ